jgi:hypothetical protein
LAWATAPPRGRRAGWPRGPGLWSQPWLDRPRERGGRGRGGEEVAIWWGEGVDEAIGKRVGVAGRGTAGEDEGGRWV